MAKTAEHIDTFFEYDLHLASRVLYIGSSIRSADEGSPFIDAYAAEKLIKGLKILESINKDPITIYLNTPGGYVYDGFAMYDAIKSSPCEVTIIGIGQIMSMGAVILQAADNRILYPHSFLMIHDGESSFEGHSRNFEVWGKHSKDIRNIFYEIFAERSHKSANFWKKKCLLDSVFTAEEAVDLGLADSIQK